MSIILPALAVAFAALCVWLTVRIINRRERWAKRTLAAVVGLPVIYVASFGPACWVWSRKQHGELPGIYHPLTTAGSNSDRVADGLTWYANLGSLEDSEWHYFGQERRFICFYLAR